MKNKLPVENFRGWILKSECDPAELPRKTSSAVHSETLVPVAHAVQVAVEETVREFGARVDHPEGPFCVLLGCLLKSVAHV